mgnify:CR=1 FL=1
MHHLKNHKQLLASEGVVQTFPKQNYTVVPESHYFAMQIQCERCSEIFWFSEHEQQYWYEELGFWIDSIPVNCPNCRRDLRADKGRA